jgi:hypothetical protein
MRRRIAPLLLAVLVAIPIVGSANAAEPASPPPADQATGAQPDPTIAPDPTASPEPTPGPDTTPTDAAQPGPTTDAGPAGDEPAPPTATAPARAPDARDRWIVLLKKGADTTRVIEKAGKRDGVKADHKFGRAVRGFSAHLDATQRKDLLADPNVAAVVPDGVVQVTGQTMPTGRRLAFPGLLDRRGRQAR